MATLIGNRYEVLEQLGAGGMGTVWLVQDKLRNQKVALKQVLMPDDTQRLAITREFHTLSTMRHPNIVSVLEYGFHENQPYFTMEYLPDSQTFDKADIGIEGFVQILQALGYLHRRGILHRDLKPGNVLVMPQGRVKVLDFGLAIGLKNVTTEGVVGTLNYMAPEIINEESPSIGSDLWSVGVMLCETLTGHHPFGSTPPEVLMSILNYTLDLSELEPKLRAVAQKLLAKEPAERYHSASEVLLELNKAAGLNLPSESTEQRESFLQAATFVGRDKEYQTLVDGLKAAAEGTSQFWLIGGEAGVGKSRLLDELRARALVDGFVVLQGQGVEGGGLPYQLWRSPAQKLTLGAPMSDLSASVLKELVPEIGKLLERDVADALTLEPKANRDRLMAALLERLRTLNSPTLIILEDLHWAHESLELLKMLIPQLKSLPVMLIGSYRHDETPTLTGEFPTATPLIMERLNAEAVAALSTSMIGAENATPELVDRLSRETEGNALFMVEIVRALAEEAGSLENIRTESLPSQIFAGGVVAALRRRLSRVPEEALSPLRLAAVIGRKIEVPVLTAAGVTEVEKWLQICAEAAVLEPYSGDWRFSHDRLREVLVQDLMDLPLLHEKAAKALESVYPDDVSYAEALAQHWRIAENAEKEVHFILQAAEQLILFSGDYPRAESLLQRGLSLNLPAVRAELFMWLGMSAERQSRFDEALTHIQSGLASNPPPKAQARLLNRLGLVFSRQGKFVDARDAVQQALTVAEKGNDRSSIGFSLNMLGTLASIQGDFPASRALYEQSIGIRRELGERHGIAANLNNLGNVAFDLGEMEAAVTYYEESMGLWKEVGDRQGTAITLNNLGRVGTDYEKRRAYHEESLSLRRLLGDSFGVANSLFNLANLAHEQEDYEAAHQYFEESLVINRTIGSLESVASSAAGLIVALSQMGKETPRSLLLEAAQAVREIDSIYAMVNVVTAALCLFPTHAPAWIGLLREKSPIDNSDDKYFVRITEQARTTAGDDAYNAALERGKSLELPDVISEIIHLLETGTPPGNTN